MTNPNSSAFKFCPGCGESSLRASNEKSFECTECGFTFYLNSAASTAAIILDNAGRLLIVVRKFDPAKGTWDLPGGFVEPGETAEEGVKREIMEELNLNVTDLTYFGSFHNYYKYSGVVYSTTDIVYKCRVNDITDIKTGDDADSYFFLSRDQIDPEQFGLESVKHMVLKFLESSAE